MKKVLLFLVILTACNICFGQQKGGSDLYLNWNFGAPINNSFVKDFSTSGGSAGYRFFLRNNLAIGVEAGWNNYNSYAPRQTYVDKEGATTTDMYKYIFELPVTATVTKYFNTGGIVYPYAKLGLGALYSEQNLYYNIYETTNSNWGFIAVPEVGAKIKLNPANHWAFNLGAQYKYAGNSYSDYNINHLKSYNFVAGFTWKLH